jgi:uncharacterized protein YggT (Ycf19 family)
MFDIIDFILNFAGLLLWFNWRSVRLDPFTRTVPATLAGTVRRAEPRRIRRWHFFAALGALLFIRAIFYGQIGPAVDWTPKLNLVVIAPAFPLLIRGQVFFLSALLFSVLSFVQTLILFYFWLLALSAINRRVTANDPAQKLVLLQLGQIARWPLVIQLTFPLLFLAALWMLLHPLLIYTGVISPVRSNMVLLEQGLVIGASAYFSLKFLLLAFLFTDLVVSYIYFGSNFIWDFVNITSRNILSPLNRLPLRFGRINFAPIIGIVVVILLLHVLPNYVLGVLDRNQRTIWPQ